MLGVCDVNMNFHYVLSGWEGSASDSRVLRDAVSRQYGLKIPTGKYIITLDKLDSWCQLQFSEPSVCYYEFQVITT